LTAPKCTEGEVSEILAATVARADRLRLGDALVNLGRELQLTDQEVAVIEAARDQTPASPITLP
jgi:plasmid stability protein